MATNVLTKTEDEKTKPTEDEKTKPKEDKKAELIGGEKSTKGGGNPTEKTNQKENQMTQSEKVLEEKKKLSEEKNQKEIEGLRKNLENKKKIMEDKHEKEINFFKGGFEKKMVELKEQYSAVEEERSQSLKAENEKKMEGKRRDLEEERIRKEEELRKENETLLAAKIKEMELHSEEMNERKKETEEERKKLLIEEGKMKEKRNEIEAKKIELDERWKENEMRKEEQKRGRENQNGEKSGKKHLKAVLTEEELQLDTFQTALTGVEGVLNDRSLTYVSDDHKEMETLMSFNLLCIPVIQEGEGVNLRHSWKKVIKILDEFWRRWLKEYITMLHERKKWKTSNKNITKGQLVLLVDKGLRRDQWKVGIVEETGDDEDRKWKDLQSREVIVKAGNKKIYRRHDSALKVLERD